jgi:hypothetical protein
MALKIVEWHCSATNVLPNMNEFLLLQILLNLFSKILIIIKI